MVQAVVGTGLFPTETIYKELYDMTDQEIEETKNKLEKEQQEQQEKAQDQQAAEQAAGVPNAEEPVAGNKVVGPAGEAPLPPKATSEDINTIKNYIKHKYNGDNEKIRLIESIDILGTKKI